MAVIRRLLGVIVLLGGLFGAAYVGIWLLFVGGIVAIIDGIKATPTDAGQIAFGLLLQIPAGVIAFNVLALLGIVGGGALLGFDFAKSWLKKASKPSAM